MGVDIDEVVEGVAHDDRIGKHFFVPGIGYGGSCLPKDTASLRSWPRPRAFLRPSSVPSSRSTTSPARADPTAPRCVGHLDGKRIAVWGLTFKGDTEDTRQSPATEVVQLLVNEGAEVVAYDPRSRPSGCCRRACTSSSCPRHSTRSKAWTPSQSVTDWREFSEVPVDEIASRMSGDVTSTVATCSTRTPYTGPAFVILASAATQSPTRRSHGMNIMIAGGAGFVGSHLKSLAVGQGHRVICVDDFSTGHIDNIDLLPDPHYELIKADVAHAPPVHVDVIAHLASPASPVDYERMPVHTMRANALGMFDC